jgi:hypothetical protein
MIPSSRVAAWGLQKLQESYQRPRESVNARSSIKCALKYNESPLAVIRSLHVAAPELNRSRRVEVLN